MCNSRVLRAVGVVEWEVAFAIAKVVFVSMPHQSFWALLQFFMTLGFSGSDGHDDENYSVNEVTITIFETNTELLRLSFDWLVASLLLSIVNRAHMNLVRTWRYPSKLVQLQ